MRVGVISDTHGLLRPEAVAALRGCQHILHAGDVGDPLILERLRQIAPVTAIRGNIDRDGPCAKLPDKEILELSGHLIYIIHSLEDLDIHPSAAAIRVIVFGHSHKPSIESRDQVTYLNPGSSGPRRFSLPVTLAYLHLDAKGAHAELLRLLPPRT